MNTQSLKNYDLNWNFYYYKQNCNRYFDNIRTKSEKVIHNFSYYQINERKHDPNVINSNI